jgi:hypothetical protein
MVVRIDANGVHTLGHLVGREFTPVDR